MKNGVYQNTAMPLLPPMCTILSWIRWSIPAPAANGSDRRINTAPPAHKPIVEPWKVIAEPAGFLIAPRGWERVSDVSNVVFTNGAIADDDGKVYIYYAASDTRLHVASTTIGQLHSKPPRTRCAAVTAWPSVWR